MQEAEKINSLTEDNLLTYIVNEIYFKLNTIREMMQLPKFYRDDAAEIAIKDYFLLDMKSEEDPDSRIRNLDVRLKEKKAICKASGKVFLSKQFQLKSQQLDNNTVFKNFCYLLEENTTSKQFPLVEPNCYTHIGIAIKIVVESNWYFIYLVMSQKSICAENCFAVKDGFIMQGQILEPNCYLYAIQLMKNTSNSSTVGPSRIFFNRDTLGFTIGIPFKPYGTAVGLGMRKVHFYVKYSNEVDVPYLKADFTDNMVQLENLELALVQTFNFPKVPERKNEIIENYFPHEYSFGNTNNVISNSNSNTNTNNVISNPGPRQMINNTMDNDIAITTNQQDSNTNDYPKGVALDIDFKTKSNSNSLRNMELRNRLSQGRKAFASTQGVASTANNPPQGSKSSGNSFFHSNFMRNGTMNKNVQMGTIPEENSLILGNDTSMYNSMRKITNNLCGGGSATNIKTGFSNNQIGVNNSSPVPNFNMQGTQASSNMAMMDNNQITERLGNKLQAEMLKSNIMTTKISSNNYSQGPMTSTSANTNMNSNGNWTNSMIPNMNASSYQMNSNQQNTNSNMCQEPMGGLMNTGGNCLQNNTNTNSYINPGIMNNNVKNIQNVNLNINTRPPFGSSKPVLQGSVSSCQNIPRNITFKSLVDVKNFSSNFLTNNQTMILSKDPKFHLDLSNNCYGNQQTCVIFPQSKNDFIKILNSFLNQNKKNALVTGSMNPSQLCKQVNNDCGMIINESLSRKKKSQPIQNKKEDINLSNIHLNKSSVKFSVNQRNESKRNEKEKDNNIYTIDYYIFKDALQNNQDHLNEKFQNQQKSEELNDKILASLGARYLTDQEQKPTYNNNPVFEELYRTMSCYDIILTIKNEEIPSHKVVLISQSQIFKEMIQKNENKNQPPHNELIKIILPDSYRVNVFKDVLKWIYCGKISESIAGDINHLREMLLMADSLKIFPLQRILIVKHIIPHMTKEASIKFLKDTYKKATSSESTEVWTLLANFSLNCISKNSSILIKNNRNEFLGMEMDLLFKCVEQSVFYLVEDIHLSNLIKLIIDRGFATDVFDLLIQLSKNYVNCRNYHVQNLDMSELFKILDPTSPTEYFYYTDEHFPNQNPKRDENLRFDKISEANEVDDYPNKNIELAGNKIELIDLKKISSNSPSTNSVSDADIKKNRPPNFTFSFQISIEMGSDGKQKISPCTIFSESFNTNNRSWNIKIDINEEGEVSFYLVEQGMPLMFKSNRNPYGIVPPNFSFFSVYNSNYELKFNSVLFDFEIRDISFEKSCVIFFSFVSGQHQIIGYDNFFNIKQLGKKEHFLFNIWIKEFPLHSACLQYISDNFQTLSTGKKKSEDLNSTFLNLANSIQGGNSNLPSIIENAIAIQDNSSNPNASPNTITLKTFYDLLPYDLTYILYSDNLKVDNENIVLTAVYRYAINKRSSYVDNLMNTIRYEFVDLKLLCTTARDHESIKNSPQFRLHFDKELNRRVSKVGNRSEKSKKRAIDVKKSIFSEIKNEINNAIDTDTEIKERQNECDNIHKLRENVKRKFYLKSHETDINRPFNITSELTSFFLDKDHHSGYIKEIDRLKKLLEEEKINSEKRETSHMVQKREMQMEIQKLNDRDSKRRKLMRDGGNINGAGQIRQVPGNENNISWSDVMKKLSNCIII